MRREDVVQQSGRLVLEEDELRLRVSPGLVRRVLLGVVLLLTAASTVAQVFAFPLGTPRGYGWVRLLNANDESSIATWYSATALLACALLLAVIGLASRRSRPRDIRRWGFLAAAFLVASIDEVAQIHEALNATLDRFVEEHGALEHPWVVPAAIAVVAVAFAYRRFVLELPAPVRRLLIRGAVVYVGGAVGLETVQGVVGGAWDGLASGLVGVLEELAEMAGVVFIIEALVTHLTIDARSLELAFSADATP